MGGGLLQIANYSTQDIFLVGNPQITFFKAVYRRCTNFAIETMPQHLYGDKIDFDKELLCTIEKNGDLIWRVRLVVDLPAVHLERIYSIDEQQTMLAVKQSTLNTATASYNTVRAFTSIVMKAYRSIYAILQTGNAFSIVAIQAIVENVYNNYDLAGTIADSFKQVLKNDIGGGDPTNLFNQLSLKELASSNTFADLKNIVGDRVNQLMLIETRYHNAYIKALEDYEINLGIVNDPNSVINSKKNWAKFAWIRRLGHFIAEYVDVLIGGHRIDRQYGDWINVWWELTRNVTQDDIYAKMIGDVPELHTFDAKEKPAYKLVVPIPFWFCRDNGLAIPLVSLNYYDLQFLVKFRKLTDLCYTDQYGSLLDADIIIQAAYFWVDYIYLDADERRRFAQSSHEYLIQQVQFEEYTDFNAKEVSFNMHFGNPVKELIFTYQRDDMTNNSDETTECQFYNYTLDRYSLVLPKPRRSVDKKADLDIQWTLIPNRNAATLQEFVNLAVASVSPVPIDTTINDENAKPAIMYGHVLLNQHVRCPEKTNMKYFNLINPYACHSASPKSPGIYCFSFAQKPEVTQPSSSCNMSRLDKAILQLGFDSQRMFNLATNGGILVTGKLRVYALSYNILRFMGGVAGTAFVFG